MSSKHKTSTKNTDLPKKSSLRDYQQGFIISLVIFITGIAIEWFTGGKGAALPRWPANLLFGLAFIALLLFMHFFYRQTNIIKWLSRVPAAASAIVFFTLLVLILGLTKQNEPDASEISRLTGLSHVRNSYVLLLSGLYLLTCLGLVALRRLIPFSFKNIGFALNHVGLWIIVFAGSLGSGDLERLTIYVNEGQTVNYAYDRNQEAREVPFEVKLLDFDIKDFPPKLAMIEQPIMKVPQDLKNNFLQIEKGMQTTIGKWDITIKEFLPSARKEGEIYIATEDSFSVPAALVEAKLMDGAGMVSGWMSCGNYMNEPVFLFLDNHFALAMTIPTAKEFSSMIEVTQNNGESKIVKLIVNDPVHVGAWNLYQTSYDEEKGKWSTLSVIEAIRDPWILIIYIGIGMVLAGAVYLFWIGRNPKN
jgi:heme/copper-type cytochrome/quinol oxidase subunit 4